MITAIAQATTELAKFANTDAGQKVITHALENQIAFEKAMRDGATWFQNLVAGKSA